MEPAQLNKLISLIDDIVNHADGSWREKREDILAACNDEQKTAISEFVGWFEED